MENGDVYTFGYGQHGQLGHGDVNSRYNNYSLPAPFVPSVSLCWWRSIIWTRYPHQVFLFPRGSPTLVQALPGPSVQVTAGSNHTAVLLMDGQVFTFGSFSVRKWLLLHNTCSQFFFFIFQSTVNSWNPTCLHVVITNRTREWGYCCVVLQKGQLGRPILDMPYWNAKPSPMPNIGAKYGRKATWIGASGDQTFLRIDEALINSHVLATSEIFASKHIIGLVPSSVSEPPPFKCLLINKMDGSCRTFNDSEQEDLQGFGLCLDPVYDVIWRSVLGLISVHIYV